jgi:hypothetical protein
VDYAVLLHGGSNVNNLLMRTGFVPPQVNEEIYGLYKDCDAIARNEGMEFNIEKVSPVFNLASALHHVSGCVSMVFESNQCIVDLDWGVQYSHDQIYRAHTILFEQLFTRAKNCGYTRGL